MVTNSSNKFFKLRTVLFKVLCIVLTLSLVTTIFTISATAGEYTSVNKSKYHLANWYGLDELPYGDDTGVVYITFYDRVKLKNIDLTICFNKCTPLVDIVGDRGSVTLTDSSNENAIIDNFTYSHLWGLQTGNVTSSGNSFLFSCISDSPVYYTFGNTGESWKTLQWSYISEAVYITQTDFYSDDGSGEVKTQDMPVKTWRTVYCYLNVDLSKYGLYLPSDTEYLIYSNKLMVNSLASNYGKDYISYYAMSFNTPLDSQISSKFTYNTARTDSAYLYACYPSSSCLRDWQLFELENSHFAKISEYLSTFDNIYFSLGTIADEMYNQTALLEEMDSVLNQMLNPESYPDGGLLNDNTYSSQLDGVVGDVEVNTDASEYITTLSASFIVIRGIWDKIVNSFGFAPVIGLLLFLAFVAYLLGRALKGRSD